MCQRRRYTARGGGGRRWSHILQLRTAGRGYCVSAAAVYRQRGRGPQVEPYPPAEDGREGYCVSAAAVYRQRGRGPQVEPYPSS